MGNGRLRGQGQRLLQSTPASNHMVLCLQVRAGIPLSLNRHAAAAGSISSHAASLATVEWFQNSGSSRPIDLALMAMPMLLFNFYFCAKPGETTDPTQCWEFLPSPLLCPALSPLSESRLFLPALLFHLMHLTSVTVMNGVLTDQHASPRSKGLNKVNPTCRALVLSIPICWYEGPGECLALTKPLLLSGQESDWIITLQ